MNSLAQIFQKKISGSPVKIFFQNETTIWVKAYYSGGFPAIYTPFCKSIFKPSGLVPYSFGYCKSKQWFEYAFHGIRDDVAKLKKCLKDQGLQVLVVETIDGYK